MTRMCLLGKDARVESGDYRGSWLGEVVGCGGGVGWE